MTDDIIKKLTSNIVVQMNNDIADAIAIIVKNYNPMLVTYEVNARIISEALEKQIPKKVDIRIRNDGLKSCYCANCGCYFGFPRDWVVPLTADYCPYCGQAIDWSDGDGRKD